MCSCSVFLYSGKLLQLSHVVQFFCSTAFIPCYGEGYVRVANTTYIYRNFTFIYGGRVEVCYNGSYGSVCDVDWDEEDAIVVCRRQFGLDYSKYSSVPDGAGKIFQ